MGVGTRGCVGARAGERWNFEGEDEALVVEGWWIAGRVRTVALASRAAAAAAASASASPAPSYIALRFLRRPAVPRGAAASASRLSSRSRAAAARTRSALAPDAPSARTTAS